jgi:hypothetical protein
MGGLGCAHAVSAVTALNTAKILLALAQFFPKHLPDWWADQP